jgi:hypothetical protein
MSGELHHKDFAPCLNDKFHVMGEHQGRFSLELIQISEETSTPKQQVFSMLFRGPADKFIPQRIHKLKHHRLGEMDIFLVPVGHDKEGHYYQAVFNRLIQQA